MGTPLAPSARVAGFRAPLLVVDQRVVLPFAGLNTVAPVKLEPVSKLPQGYQQACNVKERLVHVDLMFITDHQSPEVSDPGDAPFDLPSMLVTSQLASVLCGRLAAVGLVRTDQVDAALLEPLPKRIGIGGPVVDQTLWILSGPAASTRH